MNGLARKALVACPVLFAYPCYLYAVGTVGGNFSEVVPGELYRSAQLSGPMLDRAIRDHRIASVVNLRGGHPGDRFYDEEIEACRRNGIVHSDVSLSALRLPPPEKTKALVRALDGLPKPILVHCRAGADRTGLAVAIYGATRKGWTPEDAQARGLSWRYGHMGWGKAVAMDRFFDLYRQTSKGRDIRTWIEQDYPGAYQRATEFSDSARVAVR